MKLNTYEVYFENDYLTIYAFNSTEAIILAQANRINSGLSNKCSKVIRVSEDNKEVVWTETKRRKIL